MHRINPDQIAKERMNDPDTGGVLYRDGLMYLVKGAELVEIGPIPEELEQQFQDSTPIDRAAKEKEFAAVMARLWPETTKR